ncbi:suppressor of loss of ypt1, partial [Quaeritorhiza haematococci]
MPRSRSHTPPVATVLSHTSSSYDFNYDSSRDPDDKYRKPEKPNGYLLSHHHHNHHHQLNGFRGDMGIQDNANNPAVNAMHVNGGIPYNTSYATSNFSINLPRPASGGDSVTVGFGALKPKSDTWLWLRSSLAHSMATVERTVSALYSRVTGSDPSTSLSTSSYYGQSTHFAVSLDTVKFIILCFLWYSSSALTNNIGKQILNAYKYPVTLTYVQFAFVAVFAYTIGRFQLFGYSSIRTISTDIVTKTAPLSMFQIFGHIFSSIAISYIPVSFAHTIKAMAPLFTVIIYRIFWNVVYSPRIYVSLVPLTVGVMLVCSSKMAFHTVGFICALGSTLIFVLQNIFSKKLFISMAHASHGPSSNGLANGKSNAASLNGSVTTKTFTPSNGGKLDKLNLLFYSSFLSVIFMLPIWLYYDGVTLLLDRSKLPPSHVTFLFLLNGISHFAQNLLAFTILSMVSPVTYSIASLVKRIFVITASIVYFGDS